MRDVHGRLWKIDELRGRRCFFNEPPPRPASIDRIVQESSMHSSNGPENVPLINSENFSQDPQSSVWSRESIFLLLKFGINHAYELVGMYLVLILALTAALGIFARVMISCMAACRASFLPRFNELTSFIAHMCSGCIGSSLECHFAVLFCASGLFSSQRKQYSSFHLAYTCHHKLLCLPLPVLQCPWYTTNVSHPPDTHTHTHILFLKYQLSYFYVEGLLYWG